ncbi:hypothetical protein [Undibacterium sp.]|uniref:hypothetical protein n=1 Tax=Undibacterium sp. TaxID=1914977 RepID=UPI0027312482|nr:hypothetical protein [Undibacterium sp.]MDP1978294.1 hypothetical protein [Undibacterium sp.]
MTSTVVFDITQAGYKSYGFPAFGLFFVVLSAWMLFSFLDQKRKNFPNKSIRFRGKTWNFYCLFGCTCLWTIFTFKGTYTDYRNLRTAYEQGQCELVEGRVENFQNVSQSKPRPEVENDSRSKPRPEEQFDVGNTHFFYSKSVITAGFNTSLAAGGPMKEGLYVRIHHCGNDIARLEIVDDVKPKN